MKVRTIVLSIVGSAMFAAPALAGSAGIQRTAPSDTLAQLQAKQDEVSSRMLKPNAKGPLQVRYMDRSSQLTDLINRVQRGDPISPDEIDKALSPVAR